METPCWSPSEKLRHGGRKPMETFGVYFGSLKTFILSVKLENIRIGTSLDILVTHNSKTQGYIFVHVTCHPETMPISRIVKKPCSFFQNKTVHRAEDRPTDICLKMAFT